MDVEKYYDQWFSEVFKEITQLKVNDHIFWEVQTIMKDSENLKGNGGSFSQWLGHAYISDITVRLRRLTDSKKNARSFFKLLERLKNETKILSRERFLGLYGQNLIEVANSDFDGIAGSGVQGFSVEKIDVDLKHLKDAVHKVNEYTNHHITHLAPKDLLGNNYAPPSFDDVRKAIDIICTLALKYKLLLQAKGQTEILPVWTYNWKSIFQVPWISPCANNSHR